MAESLTQTISGTMPAITRDGQNVLLNWQAKLHCKMVSSDSVKAYPWTKYHSRVSGIRSVLFPL